jgi:hypothetical protein
MMTTTMLAQAAVLNVVYLLTRAIHRVQVVRGRAKGNVLPH